MNALPSCSVGVERTGAALSDAGLGGAAPVQIDGLPGRDSNRQMIAIRDDVAYRLWVVPATEECGRPIRCGVDAAFDGR